MRRRLEPEVRFPSEETEVAFFGDEGWIDGRALVSRLVDGAVSLGALTMLSSCSVCVSSSPFGIIGQSFSPALSSRKHF